jgi:protein SCO1/2
MDHNKNDGQVGEEQGEQLSDQQVAVDVKLHNQPERSWLRRYGFSMIMLAVCIAMGAYLLTKDDKAEELKVQAPGTEFSYMDLQGNEVTLANTNGKARLLYFFFANCPDVCPPTTFVMSQVQDQLAEEGLFGDKVEFLSVTIDPERDTPEALLEYAERFNADPNGWKFLRGDEKETADLARKYSILVEKDPEGNFAHMNIIVLLDKDGNIREWISANDYIETGDGQEKLTPNNMAKMIKSLL